MLDLVNYRIGVWTGKLTREDRRDIWRSIQSGDWDAPSVSGLLPDLFPNGWKPEHFEDEEKPLVLDPLSGIEDFFPSTYDDDSPFGFAVDMEALLACFLEDGYMVQEWDTESHVFLGTDVDGIDVPIHLAVDSFHPVVSYRESPIGFEIENYGFDAFEYIWEDMGPDLLRRHREEVEKRKEPEAVRRSYVYDRLGFAIVSGVAVFEVDWTGGGYGGYWDQPEEPEMVAKYRGVLDWSSMRTVKTADVGTAKDVKETVVFDLSPYPVPDPNRSILD